MTGLAESTVTVTQYNCQRCGHQWNPRGATVPRVCPWCKSYSWRTPRQEGAGGPERIKYSPTGTMAHLIPQEGEE